MKRTISVAIKGQLHSEDLSETNYVFPKENIDEFSVIDSDPRIAIQALGLSGAGTGFYTMAIVPKGIIYTYRRILPSRGDCAMVMMMADGPTINGQKLCDKLNDILEYALKESSSSKIDDEVISNKLSNCSDLFRSLTNNNSPLEDETNISLSPTKEGYRVYQTDDNLFEILRNPYQLSYKQYKCIHVVHISANVKPSVGSNMERIIDSSLDSTYYFDLPDNVSVKDDLHYVNKETPFILRYQRRGYNTFETTQFRASTSSKYFSIVDNDTIKVKSAEECNISFEKTIHIQTQDKAGNIIRGAKIIYNGRAYYSDENGVFTIEMPDKKETFKITADGYNESKLNIDTTNRQDYEATLESAGLRSKVYLKPAWVKKEKSMRTHIDEPCTIQYSQNTDICKRYGKIKDHEEFYVSQKNPKSLLIVICIFALLLGACISFFTTYLMVSKKVDDLNCTIDSLKSIIDLPIVQDTTPTESVLKNHEEDDEKYLSENDIWEYDSIQSKKYREFYELLIMKNYSDQNVNQYKIINSDTFPINNSSWNKIQEVITTGINGDWGDAMKYRDQFIKCTHGKIELENIIKNATSAIQEANQPKNEKEPGLADG